jgi:nicotinamidase-related amidase
MAEATKTASAEFLDWLDQWYAGLESASLDDLLAEAGGPERTTFVCEDLLEGFCRQGRLSSPRVEAIIEPIVRLMRRAHEAGVRKFVLPQDAHPPDSPEFDAYGAHCVVGTPEAETVAELKALPFADEFIIIPKQSLSPAIGTELPEWLDREGTPALAIVTGDCTDLCVYQVALYLKVRANARGERCEVVVPADCVDTYDLPVEAARDIGVVPHDAELMHRLFLYHMALNGVRVVKSVT